MNPIDLHLHTTASDGSQSPAELLAALQTAGIHTFSVTDHDTIDGALEMETLIPPGMRYVRGIEFSCVSPVGKCHILGYGYDPGDPVFLAALEAGRALRMEKLQKRLDFLAQRFGIVLTEAESRWLHNQNSPGKPHLAQILVDRGIAPDRDTAIKAYINLHKGGNDRISAETAIHAILHAGGISVWAHPLGGEGERRLTMERFDAQLAQLLQYGIRGLECHYSRYTQDEAAFLVSKAYKHGLHISAGSDSHGTNKVGIYPGKLNAEEMPVFPAEITILTVDF